MSFLKLLHYHIYFIWLIFFNCKLLKIAKNINIDKNIDEIQQSKLILNHLDLIQNNKKVENKIKNTELSNKSKFAPKLNDINQNSELNSKKDSLKKVQFNNNAQIDSDFKVNLVEKKNHTCTSLVSGVYA